MLSKTEISSSSKLALPRHRLPMGLQSAAGRDKKVLKAINAAVDRLTTFGIPMVDEA
jgi:hypothetical protein